MRARALAISGLAAAALVALPVGGEPGAAKSERLPNDELGAWATSSALPRAQIDARAPRVALEAAAWALLEGYAPPGGLAEESYDPGLTRRSASGARAKPPQVRMGVTAVTGALPPEVVQRIVRQNFGRFRLCYENGLRIHPHIEGRVVVSFVIDASGKVEQAKGDGSDLPDSTVVECIRRSFEALEFPAPERGEVRVKYPIHLAPGG